MKLRLSLTILLTSCIAVFSFAQSNVPTERTILSQDVLSKLKEKQFDMTTVTLPEKLDFELLSSKYASNNNNTPYSVSNSEDDEISPFARIDVQYWGVLNHIENNNNIYFSSEIEGTNFNVKTYDEFFNVEDDFTITVPESANYVALINHYSTDYFNSEGTREYMIYVHHFDPEIMGPEGQIWEVWIVTSDGEILGTLEGNAAYAKYDSNNEKVLYSFKMDYNEDITIFAYDPIDFEIIDTYSIDADLVTFYMGMPFSFINIDEQEYLMVSHYESLFMDNMTLEVFPDNHLIVKLLDYDFQEVKTMSFDIQSRFDTGPFVIPMANFGTFFTNSDKDFNISKDIFNSDNNLEVLYGINYYDMIQDADWSTFLVADENGEMIHELNEYIVGVNSDMLSIEGEDTQIAFLYGEDAPVATKLGFFDVESWEMVSSFDAFYQGDQISDNFNRIPFEDTYHYLVGIGSPDVVNGDYFGVINEYTIAGDLHMRHQLYVPNDVELFQPILTSQVLTPNLFTEENDDLHFLYVYLQNDGTGSMVNNLVVARDAENILVEFRGDGVNGNITNAGITMNGDNSSVDNFYVQYEAVGSFQSVDFYKLPFGETLGVDDFENVSFAIYPNPSSGVINVESNVIANDIKIYSMTGKLLHSQSLNEMRSTVNISSLARGIYIAHISLSNGSTQKAKLIKK